LLLIAASVVADAEKVAFETTVAARGVVAMDATELAVNIRAATTVVAGRWRWRGWTATTSHRRRSQRAGRRARRAIATTRDTTVGSVGVRISRM
jgi:hypothetical protein